MYIVASVSDIYDCKKGSASHCEVIQYINAIKDCSFMLSALNTMKFITTLQSESVSNR